MFAISAAFPYVFDDSRDTIWVTIPMWSLSALGVAVLSMDCLLIIESEIL